MVLWLSHTCIYIYIHYNYIEIYIYYNYIKHIQHTCFSFLVPPISSNPSVSSLLPQLEIPQELYELITRDRGPQIHLRCCAGAPAAPKWGWNWMNPPNFHCDESEMGDFLVGGLNPTPLKNMRVRQLGWWQQPNINGKIKFMATKPPTSFGIWDVYKQPDDSFAMILQAALDAFLYGDELSENRIPQELFL